METLEFKCVSGNLHVGDPTFKKAYAYQPKSIWTLGTIVNEAKIGPWTAGFVFDPEYEDRIQHIECFAHGHDTSSATWELRDTLGVDGGLMSVLDAPAYPDEPMDDSKFWGFLEDVYLASVWIEQGVVCRSGFGDGQYQMHVQTVQEQAVGVKVTFITDRERQMWQQAIAEQGTAEQETAEQETAEQNS